MRAFLALLLVWQCWSQVALPSCRAMGASGLEVFGFLPEYRVDAADFAWFKRSGVSSVTLFSLELDGATGHVTARDRLPQPARARELRATFGSAVALALGGAGRSHGFAAVLHSTQKRATAVRESVALLRELGASGLEINWQFPTSLKDVRALARFADELRSAYGPGLVLTTAVPTTLDYARAIIAADAVASFDVFHVMVYLDGVGPHTVVSAEATMRNWAALIPPNKLSLGVPFYATSLESGETITHERLLELQRGSARTTAEYSSEDGATLRSKLDIAAGLGCAEFPFGSSGAIAE